MSGNRVALCDGAVSPRRTPRRTAVAPATRIGVTVPVPTRATAIREAIGISPLNNPVRYVGAYLPTRQWRSPTAEALLTTLLTTVTVLP